MTKTKIFAKFQEIYLSAEKTTVIKSKYRHNIQGERGGRLTKAIFAYDSMAARGY